MLSIGKLAKGQEGYYLDAVARGVEDYYLEGEAPGRWLGAGTASRTRLYGQLPWKSDSSCSCKSK